MKEISLTQGKAAVVDVEDYEWLAQWKWYAWEQGNTFYAVRNSSLKDGKRKMLFMHREILGLKAGDIWVDHCDGNGLNNMRSNLRKATRSQNSMNQKKTRGRSRFKGVVWRADIQKWQSQIRINGKHKYIGFFENEIDAAYAYDNKAINLFGEFARPNFGGVKQT